MKKGYLILQDGQVFEGVRFGAGNWRFRQPIFRHGFTVLSNHFRAVFPP